MRIRAVAWDIDGTLVDSEPVHLLALKATCAQFGADISHLPDDRFIGVNMLDVWQELRPHFNGRINRSQFLEAINMHYHDHALKLRPMPHALATVAQAAQCGLRQVAVSNSARIVVDVNLVLSGLSRYMEFSLSLDDVSSGKPDPEPYLAAARRLGLDPTEIVAVEDSDTGAQSAHAAGLEVIRLDWTQSAVGKHKSDLQQVCDTILDMVRHQGHPVPPGPGMRKTIANET